MCNQTEMYLEIDRYDERAARGEVPRRGTGVEKDLQVKIRQKIKKTILFKAPGKGIKPTVLLEWFRGNFLPKVSNGDIKGCWIELLLVGKIELTPDRNIRTLRKTQKY